MATLVSKVTGNFTDASSWNIAGSVNDSEATTTAIGTSDSDSATFVPSASEINAVGIKVSSRAATPGSDTLTIKLRNSTTSTDVATITINLSDLENGPGWYVFPFSNHTPNGTDSYITRLVSSVASGVTVFASAGTTHSRFLRQTGTQAPAANDQLIIAGEHTGQGTGNSFTVTMDNTATTNFGATSFTQSLSINKRSTLSFGVTASTNYFLKIKGILGVMAGGIFNIGTSGSRMPSSSTGILEFNPTANVDSGLVIYAYGTFNAYGATKEVWNFLTANKIATDTVIAIESTTGWAASDEVCFSPTSRTNTEHEKKTILTVDSATQITLSAGLTNAHEGTAPFQGEIGNLTRSVKIRGTTSTLCGYIHVQNLATANFDYVQFSLMGASTVNKTGLTYSTNTNAQLVSNCAFHDCTVNSCVGISFETVPNLVIDNNVLYNINGIGIRHNGAACTAQIINNLLIFCSTGISILVPATITINDNYISASIAAGSAACFIITGVGPANSIARNVLHSFNVPLTSGGLRLNNCANLTIDDMYIWRGVQADIASGSSGHTKNIIFNNLNCTGGSAWCITLSSSPSMINLTFNNCIFKGDPVLGDLPTFLNLSNAGSAVNFQFNNCEFYDTTTWITASAANSLASNIIFNNCIQQSDVEFATQANLLTNSIISAQRYNQTENYFTWKSEGTLQSDTTNVLTSSKSLKMTPLSASLKLTSLGARGGFLIPALADVSKNIAISIRKSADYNGNQPRLIVRPAFDLGITSITILATYSAGTESWNSIDGDVTPTEDGVLEVYVDCDGTVGYINIDNLVVT